MIRNKVCCFAGMLFLFLSAIGQVQAAERVVAKMGELRASVNAQDWCGPVVQVQVDAPPGVQLTTSSRELQLLSGGVRQILKLECPGIQELQLTGRSAGQVSGQWQLTEEGVLASIATPPATDIKSPITTGSGKENGTSNKNKIIGTQAVADRFLLWVIGNNPELASALYIQQRLRHYDFPPGLPEVPPGYSRDTSKAQARLEAAGALYADKPPVDVMIELPMRIRDDDGDPQTPPRVSAGYVQKIGNTAAITHINVRDGGFGSHPVHLQLLLEKPFYLPLPDEFTPVPDAMLSPGKGKAVARISATLSDFSADVRGGFYRNGKAQATLHSISYIYRPTIRNKGPAHDGPDEVLHVWQSGDVKEFKLARPVSASDIANVFGGGASEERYVLNGHTLPNLTSIPPRPVLQSAWQARAFMFAMRKALSDHNATMRQRVQSRVPRLPVPMRFVGSGVLGEYDFARGGFPVSLQSNSGTWLPVDSDGRNIIKSLPNFLPIGSADAEALINTLSQGQSRQGRVVKLVIDYDLEKLAARTGHTGPMSKQEVASVRPVFSSITAGLYSEANLSQPLYALPVPEGFESFAPEAGSLPELPAEAPEAPDQPRVASGFDEKSIDAPEKLLLDPEGLDLLALSLAPAQFSDSTFRRMLVDRSLKERHAKATTQKAGDETEASLNWQAFFENTDQPLRAGAVDALLPQFRAWTLARAKALPNTLLLPGSGDPNPISGCGGLRVLRQPDVDMNRPFLQTNLPKILGPDVTLTQDLGRRFTSGRSKAGPDIVWHWKGNGNTGTALDCRYISSALPTLDKGIRPDNSPYVSTLVVVRDQPSIGGVNEIPDSFIYTLSLDDLRFVPSSSLNKPPEGLIGFVVLTSRVEAAEAFRQERFGGGGYKSVGRIKAGDWDAIVATPPKSLDILGIALEVPLADFESAMRDRMPSAIRYSTAVPGKGIFGYAQALVDADTGEAVTAIYADHIDGKPLVALNRRLELNASETSAESLKLALEEKYGTDYREENGTHFYWGALPETEDRLGYCGGYPTLNSRDDDSIPYFELLTDEAQGAQRSHQIRAFLSGFGWPSAFKANPAYDVPDIGQCTTLIAVTLTQSGPRLYFSTWLFNRSLAERMDAVPRPGPAKATTDL
ncbi:MAG: hypothetical protein HLX50_03240 [Alteromonadaceae bacterium]|nr:hypothetical protein [Alteromonadaceae bacterium]